MTDVEKKMAAEILRYEDYSVTGPDTLCIRRLPSADHSGTWEICGICDGIEPDVYKRISKLLLNGKKQECYDACCEYVWEKTSPVTDWFETESYPALHFLTRDMFFNAGSKGAAKVLQRVCKVYGHANLRDDGIFGSDSKKALEDVLMKRTQISLIGAFEEKRIAYYQSLRKFRIFGQGWVNRAREASSFAKKLLSA